MPDEPRAPQPTPLDPFASETRIRELVEQLPVGVYVDTDELRPSTLYMSPNVGELLGHPHEAYLSDVGLWARSIHPDDLGSLRETWKEAWAKGHPYRVEYRLIRPDGREVWIRDSSVLLVGDDGKRLAWRASSRT